jgi:hypothetical protein
MSTGDKTNLKQLLREECLPALARQAAYFSVADVRDWLRERNLTCPPALRREYSRISLARLLDYARERRPAGLELARHIKAELLKKSALVGSDDKP